MCSGFYLVNPHQCLVKWKGKRLVQSTNKESEATRLEEPTAMETAKKAELAEEFRLLKLGPSAQAAAMCPNTRFPLTVLTHRTRLRAPRGQGCPAKLANRHT